MSAIVSIDMDFSRPHRAIVPSLEGDVLAVLVGTRMPLTGREVSRLAGASHTGVRRALDHLVDHGLVTVEAAGAANLFQLNRDHVAADVALALAGLRQELLGRLRDHLARWDPAPVHVSLYGSAARRAGGPDSDIDLFVVRPDEVDPEEPSWENQLDDLRDSVSRWTGNEVQVVEISEHECAALVAEGHEVIRAIREDGVDLAGKPARMLLRARTRT